MNEIRKFDLESFTIGILVLANITSLTEDIMGKEVYFAFASASWVPAYVSIPIAIISILLVIFILYWKNKKGT